MSNNEQAANVLQQDNGKTVAIVSYLSIIGWIIALVLHNNNKTSLGAYHLRQTITLYIIAIALGIAESFLVFIPFIGWLIGIAFIFLFIGIFVLWIIGFIAAINGQEKPIPVIGSKSQQWFAGIK
ncbi:MAG: hypothetical protein PW786_07225 [Arachidicoccus sp.]|nr:hypothetical protein [Arachidicoccus sp.]